MLQPLKCKLLFSYSYTNTSSITGDQLSPYMWKPLAMLSALCALMMIGYVTAVYYVCASCKFTMSVN